MAFTNLREATREDWDRIDALDEARTDYAAAPLALLESLKGGDPAGYTLNPYDHSRQAATRALRAGESSEFIVSVLFHDAADRLAPANHGQIAAELLRPFVVDDHYWMVQMHGLFQKENFTHHTYWGSGVLDAMLDPYRDHPAFDLTQRFCRDYDATSFDPDYDACRSRRSCPRSARSSSGRTRSRRSPGDRRVDCSDARASAPELAELPGERPALVVPGSSGGRTQRRIHRVGAEHVLGVAAREDRLDAAAACAELVDLCREMRAPGRRRERSAAEWRQHQHPCVAGGQIGILGVGSVAAVDVAAVPDPVGTAAGTAGGDGVRQVDAAVAVEHDRFTGLRHRPP